MPRTRPNVLHLFTDQQRADTIAALGNPVIRTPNLDRLVAGGTSFTRAYTPSPVCVSARCSMTYGQYPHNTGCYDNSPMPTDGRLSLMDALTEAGYRTHGVGKCHFSPDRDALRGFQSRERQEELVPSPDDDHYVSWLRKNGFDHVADPHGIRGEMYYVPQPAQMPAQLHPTQWIGDRATAFIEDMARSPEPWYLFSSFIDPHPPFAPPSPWHKLYRAPVMPLPNVPLDVEALQTYVNRFQNRYKYRDQGLDQNLIRSIKAYYYATISFVDMQVGRILDALASTRQLDNTLILFGSDHGEFLGDYNCFGKRSMQDSASRIPLIAQMPGRFEQGAICSEPANLVDIVPTILSATGAEIASHELDGTDLAEVASGNSERQMVFAQFQQSGNAIYMAASRDLKYYYSAPDDTEYLFDRITDPDEARNRAYSSWYEDARDGMKRELIGHLSAGGETSGIEEGDWKRFPTLEVPSDPDAGLLVQDHSWANTAIPGYTS
jgi:arylsulfatase